MRASRLLSILILLQMRGRMNAEALAEEFEVSVRTIYRDIDQLSAAGVPVYAERGRTGGFALLDGYRTKLTGFTPAEADALLLAGVGGVAADLGIGAELAAAQLKLLASLPPDAGASAQRVAARFHLDPVRWYANADDTGFLPSLAAAVWGEKRVRVKYESWKDVVERELDPLGLVLKGGVWYLVANVKDGVKGAPRSYRVSNMRELVVTEAGFARPARFNLERYWTRWTKAFETQLYGGRATVELSREGLRVLREVSPIAAQAVDAKHRAAKREGWVQAEIPVEGPEYSARQLLSLGTEVRVVGPPELRNAVANAARKVAGMYGR